MAFTWNEDDFDLDLHQIWEDSDLPASPPSLAMGVDEAQRESSFAEKTMAQHVEDPIVECVFYSSTGRNHAVRWTGPSPLLLSTNSEDIFLYISAFISERVGWLEARLEQVDPFTRGVLGEHLFFIPRMETVAWRFQDVRKDILDIVSHSASVVPGSHFRLSLWPRLEPFPYSASSTLSPLVALPVIPALCPSDFVHNIRAKFM
ncbi:hypothetical protein N7540_011023 [Penicillium herquei]|nr:hypothetical protein N7540_011023 [Penicillium herquei]